jgi:uncharacterized integral membrane protein
VQFYVILGLLFSLVVAIFAVQNSTSVDVKFLAWGFNNISLVLVIITSVVGGALITLLFSLPTQLRNVMKINDLKAKNQKLTTEMENLTPNKPQTKQHPGGEGTEVNKKTVGV